MKIVCLLLTVSLLCACGNNDYSNEIEQLNSRIELLEEKVSKLESQSVKQESKKNNNKNKTNETVRVGYQIGENVKADADGCELEFSLKSVKITSNNEDIYAVFNTERLNNSGKSLITGEFSLNEGEVCVIAEYDIVNTGGLIITERIFTPHRIRQNGRENSGEINIEFNSKYNYGMKLCQSVMESNITYSSLHVEVLNKEKFYLISHVPKEMEDMPFEISFIIGDSEYTYSSIN